MPETTITILNAAIEQHEEFDQVIIRGTIEQSCLTSLKVDKSYQREGGFSDKEIKELVDLYVAKKKVPDIVLGIRGTRYRTSGSTITIHDPVYIIDGVQRMFAVKVVLRSRPDLPIQIGCKIFVNTTSAIENEMFCAMNTGQQRVSASVLVRNKYDVSPASKAMVDLNKSPDFALRARIGWDQKLRAGHSLQGFGLCRIAGALHSYIGGSQTGRAYDLLERLDRVASKIDAEVMHDNVVKYFDVIERAWGVEKLPKLELMCMLARVFASYDSFWDGEEFFMPTSYAKHLKKINPKKMDESIRALRDKTTDLKMALFEVLRQKLHLHEINGRRVMADADVTMDDARGPRA